VFSRVITHPGFWKSVIVLGVIYMSILMLIQWAFNGFSPVFFLSIGLLRLLCTFLIGAFICGFSVSYAKFWGKLKRDDHKNK